MFSQLTLAGTNMEVNGKGSVSSECKVTCLVLDLFALLVVMWREDGQICNLFSGQMHRGREEILV